MSSIRSTMHSPFTCDEAQARNLSSSPMRLATQRTHPLLLVRANVLPGSFPNYSISSRSKVSYYRAEQYWYEAQDLTDSAIIKGVRVIVAETRMNNHLAAFVPRISIVTPVFNSAVHLEQTIQSVLGQAYPNVEHIIIDGGSTDATLDIIRRYEPRLAFWSSEPDGGLADAFNKGLRRATGDLIGIINSDDFYAPGVFNQIARAYCDDQVILHGDMNWVDDYGALRVSPRRRRYAHYLDMPFFHPTCFVPRATYECVGIFDQSIRLAVDFDFVLRAMKAGIKFKCLPFVIANVRSGGLSTQHTRQCFREVLRSQLKHGLNPLVCSALYAAKLIRYYLQGPPTYR